MKGKTKAKVALGATLAAIPLAVLIASNCLAGYYSTVITRFWSGTFSTVSTDNGDTRIKAQDAAADLTETVAEEGTVLLKNNGLLPMAPTGTNKNIVLLGGASYAPTYVGVGSVSQGGDYLSNDFIDFYDAFETAGFKVDKTMKKYYELYGSEEGKATGSMNGEGWTSANGVVDIPMDDSANGVRYKNALDEASKAAGTGTAVIVFSRVGAEGGDCKMDMTGAANTTAEDNGKHYLELMQSEIDLVHYAQEHFAHTIVVINSSNPMELGILDEEKVDAAFWIGGPGSTGIQALADIITGDVTPSGHLVDTYAYDMTTAPAYWGAISNCSANGGQGYTNYAEFAETTKTYNGVTYTFNNKVDGGVTYDVEGIYVGYRWYETADAENFWTSDYAKTTWGVNGYDDVVQYPFGYGLSYTKFDWQIESFSVGGLGGEITATVKVTNVGNYAGKDVVQLYYTAPYIKGGIEKSSKVLGAFAKTKELKKGESQVVTLKMDVDDLASYDYQNAKAYVADAGEYFFNFQTDAHNVKVNSNGDVLDTKSTKIEERIYNENGVGKRSSDLTVATNAFDLSSQGDGMIGNTIPWTSRADFQATHPQKTMGGKRVDQIDLTMGVEMINHIKNSYGGSDIDMETVDKNYVSKSMIDIETNAKNGLTCEDVAGYTEWDDEIWDLLVNQMSVDELAILLEDCGYGTPAIDSIGKTLATDVDGPAGISSANLNYYGNEYCTEPVMAATWNVELVEKIGASVAREAKVAGVNGWYAPGCDLHRSPFNGRTGEYFSEDGLLTGIMAAAEVKGAQENGLYVYLKHFAANDNDQARGGMYTWVNEQELRELQLKAWEIPTKTAALSGVMEAYNRIGPVECSVNYGLNTTVLKNEWGFKGMGLTDGYSAAIGCDKYEHPDLQLRAGCGQLLYTGGFTPGVTAGGFTENTTKTEAGIAMLHDAAKAVIYRHVNSNAMNITRDYTPYWVGVVVAIDIVLLAIAAVPVVFLIVKPIKKDGE